MSENLDDKVVQEIVEKFGRAKRWIASKSSTSYFILGSYKVMLIESGDEVDIGAVDKDTLYLTPKWLTFGKLERGLILLHEIHHILMRHVWRGLRFQDEHPDKVKALIIAEECKVNWAIKQIDRSWSISGWVEPSEYASPEDLDKDSTERLALKLHKNGQNKDVSGSNAVAGECKGDDGKSGNGEGKIGKDGKLKTKGEKKVIEDGDNPPKDEGQLSEKIKDAIMASKIAGNTLSNTEKGILGELTKSRVNWKTELRSFFNNMFGRNVIGSWRRPNRRGLPLPSRVMISKPRVWNFIDVSGSISQEEYRQFCSEMDKQGEYMEEARFIAWDTQVQWDKKYTKFQDVKVSFKGGGGTSFKPIWEQYRNKIKPNDIVVVFTDGYWFEPDEWYPKSRAKMLMITTSQERGKGFDKVIKINRGENENNI